MFVLVYLVACQNMADSRLEGRWFTWKYLKNSQQWANTNGQLSQTEIFPTYILKEKSHEHIKPSQVILETLQTLGESDNM